MKRPRYLFNDPDQAATIVCLVFIVLLLAVALWPEATLGLVLR